MSRRLAFIPLALVALVLISASFLSSSFHSGDRIVGADPSVASAAHSGFAYQTQPVQHAMPPQEGCSLPAAQ